MRVESNGVHDERLIRPDQPHRPRGGVPARAGADETVDAGWAPDEADPPTRSAALQRLMDVVGAAVLIVLALPVVALAALLVKLTSPGPAVYTQVRVGRGGRPYTIYKLRTMVHNCERDTGPRWSGALDARVTRVGRLLRRYHLDELPQLWNVLKGEMSLVGPRPERPEFVPLLAKAIPGYEERHAVRPGMTGLAQVQLPPDTDVDSVRRKLKYDLWYVHRGSFWLDLRVLVSTAYYLVGVPFGRVPAYFRVPDAAAVEVPDGPALDGVVLGWPGQHDTQVLPETHVVPQAARTAP